MDKKIIEYILSGTRKYATVRKIYPSNHYIFLGDANRINRRVLDKMRSNLTSKGKQFRDIDVSPSAMKKFTENIREIDEKLDKIFKNYGAK
jgi:hypothetical protein